MGPSKADLVLVFAADQLLDYYEVNGKPMPETISIDSATYEALCRLKNCATELTHYRGARLKIVKKNCKT